MKKSWTKKIVFSFVNEMIYNQFHFIKYYNYTNGKKK